MLNQRLKNYFKISLVTFFVFAVLVSAGSIFQKRQNRTIGKQEEFIASVDVLSIGDLLYHGTFLHDMRVETFSLNYKHFEEQFNEADLVIANYETTSNPNYQYSGYPQFNTPVLALDAISLAGIDVLNTNNNHSLDTGLEGLKLTLGAIRERGMKNVGTTLPDDPKRIDIIKNGIRIGLLSYNYGYNGLEASLSQADRSTYLSEINESRMEQEIKESVSSGNDFTLVIMHWGNEYQITPSSNQKELAAKIASWGADVILGSHPHVVQSAEMIGTTLVTYSHGNFVSNQRLETLENKETERGLMSGFQLTKNLSTGAKKLENIEFTPTWVYRYGEEGSFYYEVIPTPQYLENKVNVEIPEIFHTRIKETNDIILERVKLSD